MSALSQIPVEATKFDAPVEFKSQPAGEAAQSTSVPISILARTNQPIDHWFWGKNVHDFAGMKIADSIPIDYCHDGKDIVGVANSFDRNPKKGLMVGGMLTPFTATDRASEIIHKQKQSVPYQSSIFFDPNELVVEDVGPGMSSMVNGTQFDGPGVIFRKSVLRGLALCPYGADRNTQANVTFDATKFSVSIVKGNQMAAENESPETELEETETPNIEATETPAKEAPTKLTGGKPKAKKTGPDFLTAFGDKGGKWFAEGKTFDEAQSLFHKEVADENAALKAKNAELEAQLTSFRGEKEPAKHGIDATPTELQTKVAKLTASLGSTGLAAFAAGIELPGKKPVASAA